MTQETTPPVTDERLTKIACGYSTEGQVKVNRELQHLYNAAYLGAKEVRDIYEAERAALLKERDEALRLVRQSEGVLIEARVYVDANRDDVRGEYITDTWEEDVERSVSNINATLGSISAFLSTQTPTDR